MRVLVCGGRDYCDQTDLWEALDSLHRKAAHDAMLVIQGGANGADQLAREWCVAREVEYLNYPADWKRFGRAAGPLRNKRMLDDGRPDLVLAFPGNSGTADMVRRAEAAGVRVEKMWLPFRGQRAPIALQHALPQKSR